MKTTSSVEGKKEFTLQTVERALSFLEYLSTSETPPTVKAVADALGLNLTTCYHLQRTLTSRGYVDKKVDGTLTLGSSVGVLFYSYQRSFDVSEELREVVRKIEKQTAETSFLSTLDGRTVILKFVAEGSQQLRVGGLNVGRAGNELKRASGKAVLAHLPDPTRRAMIERNLAMPDWSRRVSFADIERELAMIRERGWSMDDEESESGVTGIAAPVFDSGDQVYGAVGLVAPTSRLGRTQSRIVEIVISAAADASQILRHSGR